MIAPNIRAAVASVTVATILIGLKVWAVWDTGSVAMLGSLADTVLDLIASVVTLYSVHLASTPADRQHRFGHGKAEAISALFQVILISLSAFGIGARAIGQWVDGATTKAAESGIAVSIVALALTLALVAYQRRIIAQTGSIAIQTDKIHYQSDLLLNAAVIAALLLDFTFGFHGADALFGIGIAAFLLYGAFQASGDALDQLMDKEWPEQRRRKFLAVANAHPELEGIHDLRTRTSGDRDFVQFHVWVDPAMTVGEAHRVMDEVEDKLRDAFPGVEILIHPDPTGHIDHGPELQP
ncbi:MAG: cation diffusion facilitator family transporter [Rhizorhabdus sp.]|nr:cation diffusion facilitator family transporter [Rhizorhabdus sp.]